MGKIYIFADEAGNFDFKKRSANGRSRFFVLTTVTTRECTVGQDLLDLRRNLAWEGVELEREFHATQDEQRVRDRVYGVLEQHSFRIDATILDKRKAYERFQGNPDQFYKLGLFLHLKYVAPRVATSDDELLFVGASFGERKKQALLHQAIKSVVSQVAPTFDFRTAFWPAASDPCLQVADYCCWAIQRKWERGDERSYILIRNKLYSEFAPFR